MARFPFVILTSLCHVMYFHQSKAGTRMLEPPSRATLWRYGYNTPRNVHDDLTDCGGYERHYLLNRGNCGICGDPNDEPKPRKHEAGGLLAPDPRPVRAYQRGSYVTVVMETSSNLFGKFEFRLCNVSHNMVTPDQDCFDQNLLAILEAGQGISYDIGSRQGLHVLNLHLPDSLTCHHCIIQWTHKTGYMTNKDSCLSCPGGVSKCHVCRGCGNQVWFVGCADITIFDKFSFPPSFGAQHPDVTTASAASTTTTAQHPAKSSPGSQCTCSNSDLNDNLINASPPYPGRLTDNIYILNATDSITTNNNSCHNSLTNNGSSNNLTSDTKRTGSHSNVQDRNKNLTNSSGSVTMDAQAEKTLIYSGRTYFLMTTYAALPPASHTEHTTSLPPVSHTKHTTSLPPASHTEHTTSLPPVSHTEHTISLPPVSHTKHTTSLPTVSHTEHTISSPPASHTEHTTSLTPVSHTEHTTSPPASHTEHAATLPPASHTEHTTTSPPASHTTTSPPASHKEHTTSSPQATHTEHTTSSRPPASHTEHTTSSLPPASHTEHTSSPPPASHTEHTTSPASHTEHTSSSPPASHTEHKTSPASHIEHTTTSPPASHTEHTTTSPPASHTEHTTSSPPPASHTEHTTSSPPASHKEHTTSSPQASHTEHTTSSRLPASHTEHATSSPAPASHTEHTTLSPPASHKEHTTSSPPTSNTEHSKISPPTSHKEHITLPPALFTKHSHLGLTEHTTSHVGIKEHTTSNVGLKEHTSHVGSTEHTTSRVGLKEHTTSHLGLKEHTSHVGLTEHTTSHAGLTEHTTSRLGLAEHTTSCLWLILFTNATLQPKKISQQKGTLVSRVKNQKYKTSPSQQKQKPPASLSTISNSPCCTEQRSEPQTNRPPTNKRQIAILQTRPSHNKVSTTSPLAQFTTTKTLKTSWTHETATKRTLSVSNIGALQTRKVNYSTTSVPYSRFSPKTKNSGPENPQPIYIRARLGRAPDAHSQVRSCHNKKLHARISNQNSKSVSELSPYSAFLASLTGNTNHAHSSEEMQPFQFAMHPLHHHHHYLHSLQVWDPWRQQKPSNKNLQQQPSNRNLQQQPRNRNLQQQPSTRNLQQQPSNRNLQQQPSNRNLQQQPSTRNLQQQFSRSHFREPQRNSDDRYYSITNNYNNINNNNNNNNGGHRFSWMSLLPFLTGWEGFEI